MVGQNGLQPSRIGLQGIQRAGGQPRERPVVGRKHGERSGAFQRLVQTRDLDQLHQCRQVLCSHRRLHNVKLACAG